MVCVCSDAQVPTEAEGAVGQKSSVRSLTKQGSKAEDERAQRTITKGLVKWGSDSWAPSAPPGPRL